MKVLQYNICKVNIISRLWIRNMRRRFHKIFQITLWQNEIWAAGNHVIKQSGEILDQGI